MEFHSLLAQTGIFSSTQYWVLLVTGLAFGFYMAWSIGANDVANAMGTSVGSRALTLKQAIIVAGVLEFVGAFLVGPHVSATIRKDIIPIDQMQVILQAEGVDGAPLYVYGMLAALLAAATWLMVATYFGLPVSTTHSIVGAVLGFGVVVLWGHWDVINWGKVGEIVSSWVLSPLTSGLLSFVIFSFVQRLVLFQRDMVSAAKRVAPFLVFAVFEVITLVTLWKGLKHLEFSLTDMQAILLATTISVVMAVLSTFLLRRVNVAAATGNPAPASQNPMIAEELAKMKARLNRMERIAHGELEGRLRVLGDEVGALQSSVEETHQNDVVGSEWGTPEMRATERIFAYLQIISACAVAFAHGANDVANAVGPLGGVIAVLDANEIGKEVSLAPGWLLGVLALGGLGIVIGLATWGWRVIETIGRKITELTPTRGFSAEFGAAVTILVASRSGMPISTTHTLVGAVLGVGFARGIGALNLRVVRDIVLSWIVTLPVGAGLAIVFYLILKTIMS